MDRQHKIGSINFPVAAMGDFSYRQTTVPFFTCEKARRRSILALIALLLCLAGGPATVRAKGSHGGGIPQMSPRVKKLYLVLGGGLLLVTIGVGLWGNDLDRWITERRSGKERRQRQIPIAHPDRRSGTERRADRIIADTIGRERGGAKPVALSYQKFSLTAPLPALSDSSDTAAHKAADTNQGDKPAIITPPPTIFKPVRRIVRPRKSGRRGI